MDERMTAGIVAWVTEAGLAGTSEPDLLRGFCERMAAAGVPLARAIVVIDTLHPVYEGRAFHWRRDPTDERLVIEYGRTSDNSDIAEGWLRSPFYHLLETGGAPFPRPTAPRGPRGLPPPSGGGPRGGGAHL